MDDTIPKTVPYKEVKEKAAETRAKLTGGKTAAGQPHEAAQTNGKKQKTLSNGFGVHDVMKKSESTEPGPTADAGPSLSLDEDEDVQMTG